MSRGGTFAFIVTLSNRIQIVAINPINQRLFFVPELGMFQMDQSYRYIMGRSEVFLYHQLSTNPLSLSAIVELTKFLNNGKRNRLDMHELAIYVEKIRKVEQSKKLIDALTNTAAEGNEEAQEAVRKYLQQVYEDGSLQYSIEKLADLSKPKDKALSDQTTDWLNAYYGEDVVSRHFVMLSMIIQEKYRMKQSFPPNMGIPFPGKASGKRNIAMIVINDAIIEPDINAKVELNEETGIQELKTSHFGTFDIKEAKTRYKYGKKQNVYFVMVRTKTAPTVKPKPEDDRHIEAEAEQLPEAPPEIQTPKAKAGRKPKTKAPIGDPVEGTTPPPLNSGLVESDQLKGYYFYPDRPQILYQAQFIAEEIKRKGKVAL